MLGHHEPKHLSEPAVLQCSTGLLSNFGAEVSRILFSRRVGGLLHPEDQGGERLTQNPTEAPAPGGQRPF